MTTAWSDIDEGDAVLLRFESHFNQDITQTVAGVVVDADGSEIVIDSGEDHYWVSWGGGVDRQQDVGEWMSYGGDGRVWLLDPVDPITDDIREGDLGEGDKRAVDPLLDTDKSVADDIYYRTTGDT